MAYPSNKCSTDWSSFTTMILTAISLYKWSEPKVLMRLLNANYNVEAENTANGVTAWSKFLFVKEAEAEKLPDEHAAKSFVKTEITDIEKVLEAFVGFR